MPKIKLPPKVRCWRCEGEGEVRDFCGSRPDLVGVRVPCPYCEGTGERYVFDDLAAAVCEAGLFYQERAPHPNNESPEKYQVEIFTHPRLRGWREIIAEAPNPTTALLNAILNANAR